MIALRQVLAHFERQSGAVSFNMMAQDLGIDRPMLQQMIDYWVRKGRLREVVSAANCTACGCSHGCPFVFELPRSYELVTGEALSEESPACPHCGGHKK